MQQKARAVTETTEIPPETLKAATLEDVLPLSRLTLVGTIEAPGETRAMIRHGSGRVEIVGVGDTVGRARVVAIETSALIVTRAGQAHRLEIPERAPQSTPDAT